MNYAELERLSILTNAGTNGITKRGKTLFKHYIVDPIVLKYGHLIIFFEKFYVQGPMSGLLLSQQIITAGI